LSIKVINFMVSYLYDIYSQVWLYSVIFMLPKGNILKLHRLSVRPHFIHVRTVTLPRPYLKGQGHTDLHFEVSHYHK
jgi:hypothetical protein